MPAKKLTPEQGEALRRIPAVEQLLSREPFLRMQEHYSRDLITEALRTVTAEIRRQILDSAEIVEPPEELAYAALVRAELESLTAPTLRPIVNVTGTITHTNLGRSLLSASVSENLAQAAANYVNLEYDLDTGARGHRDRLTEPLLQRLTGCEASTIVNNNAAAVLLALNTLARGKEVIVSRGELIEIGGAFRVPDVMEASGAILRGGRHNEPNTPAGLRERNQRKYGIDAQGTSEQLQGRRIRFNPHNRGTHRTWASARHPNDGRSWEWLTD